MESSGWAQVVNELHQTTNCSGEPEIDSLVMSIKNKISGEQVEKIIDSSDLGNFT